MGEVCKYTNADAEWRDDQRRARQRQFSSMGSEPIPKTYITFILGDFNVRLQGRLTVEKPEIGPHIFGKGVQ